MVIAYIDRYNGAIYTKESDMRKAWAANYDGGDDTNCAIWQDQYICIKVYANGKMKIVPPPHMHGTELDDYFTLVHMEEKNMFHEGEVA